ncbi:NAD(P)H-hydrate dehydratase [Tunturiibacter empetritectus]|uniref:NAD(P)H-hydrate dehydratase n=1 Tax=Tunturiibacter empetritectus TaxID=3069691 RepID=UPI003D9BD0B5
MASLACLRSGAGLVTAAVPKSILDTVTRIAPELMMVPLAEGTKGAVSFKNLDGAKLDALVTKISVVAVGPGLSTEGDAPAFARQIVEKTMVPVVIDADALNAFEGKTDLLNGEGRVMVLTPHPGEMARLAGMTVKEVEADRVGLARRFATKHKLTLVLKGWRTLIAHPDGSIAVNTSGNPAMAKGGSGDILTGIVAAMLAQFPGDVGSRGGGGGLSAWAGGGLCGACDGRAYCTCNRYGYTSFGCVSLSADGCGWAGLDLRVAGSLILDVR